MNNPARRLSAALLLVMGHFLGLGSCAAPVPMAGAANRSGSERPPCGTQCVGAHGEGSCVQGACRMVSCIPGFCDLDGDFKNGCESRTKGCHINQG